MGICLFKTNKQVISISYLERAITLGDNQPETAHYLQLAQEYVSLNKAKEGTNYYSNIYYFTVPLEMADNGELGVSLEMENEENILGFSPERIQKIVSQLPELDKSGRELIKQEFPDEDENKLPLGTMIVYPDNSFSIGYDAGESDAAGYIGLYVHFSPEFKRDDELIFEAY